MFKKSKFSNGFVLYEVIIYMLVATLVVYTINNEIFLTKKIITQEADEVIIWHDAMLRLQDSLYQAKAVKIENNRFVFVTGPNTKIPNKQYAIEKYKDMLRMTGVESGHAPILVDLKLVDMKVEKDEFYLRVKTKRGKIFEYIVPIKKA